jgi:death-on-curing protein
MRATIFLTLAEAIELHTRLIERFGGKLGVHDMGLLESALMRPQTGYYGTISLQAGALLQSLVMNHPFIDGNKRVAFAAAAIFLRMNGYSLKVSADDAEFFLVEQVIKERIQLNAIAEWIEKFML